MAASASWIAEATRTYFGNAASKRDYRVQMRGSKPFWVFTLYVLCLGLIGLSFYWATLGQQGLSIVDAQSRLNEFFVFLVGLLAAAICVIAPALTGTAIVAERQRLSLDLVLSAPVEPKYLLVGKMISSYRYTWMLLILSLPVVAMSVVLGGATWSDVFGCFLLLSFHALIFTSLALLISSVTTKPASAVIWSFFAVAGYVIVVSVLSGNAISSAFSRSSTHLPFTIALNPFMTLQAINSTTLLGTHEVPNWVLAGIVSLLLTRLFLLGAAVNLAPLDRRLSANLRLSGLIYTFGLGCLIMYAMAPIFAPVVSMRFGGRAGPFPGSPNPDLFVSVIALAAIAWLPLSFPMFSCYSGEGSRRFWFNGRFSIRHLLDGTPAGNLPYMLLMAAIAYAGAIVGLRLASPIEINSQLAQSLVWPLGFIVFGWSIGQLLSAATSALRTARALHLAIMLVTYAAVPMTMMMMQLAPAWNMDPDRHTSSFWYLWPFDPFISPTLFQNAWIYGSVMLAIGLLLTLWSWSLESKRRGRVVG